MITAGKELCVLSLDLFRGIKHLCKENVFV